MALKRARNVSHQVSCHFEVLLFFATCGHVPRKGFGVGGGDVITSLELEHGSNATPVKGGEWVG